MGIPEMRKRGYPDDIATGSICAGGTLGILIPPSITFILYGIATETSIGRLFLAGVMPGLMLTGLFMLWTMFIIWKQRLPLHAIEFPLSAGRRNSSRSQRSRRSSLIIFGVMYVALRRRRDAVGSGRRRRGAVRGAGRRHLSDVVAGADGGSSCATPRASR